MGGRDFTSERRVLPTMLLGRREWSSVWSGVAWRDCEEGRKHVKLVGLGALLQRQAPEIGGLIAIGNRTEYTVLLRHGWT